MERVGGEGEEVEESVNQSSNLYLNTYNRISDVLENIKVCEANFVPN